MKFPSFMGNPSALASGQGAFATSAPQRALVSNFSLDTQRFDNWCWAAVTQAVERVKGNEVAQDKIASDHIGRGQPGRSCDQFDPTDTTAATCLVNACKSCCNATHSLRWILTERELLAKFISQPPAYEELKAEVTAGRPVPCRIQWNNGGGAHFVCVAGCSDDGGSEQFVTVYDPLNPDVDGGPADRVELRFVEFRDRFRSGTSEGKLSYAYLVR